MKRSVPGNDIFATEILATARLQSLHSGAIKKRCADECQGRPPELPRENQPLRASARHMERTMRDGVNTVLKRKRAANRSQPLRIIINRHEKPAQNERSFGVDP